jgi:antitoxin component of MazEF toxin-antitoxin module
VLRVLRNLETAGCLVYIPIRYMPKDAQVEKWRNSLAVRIPKALAGKARHCRGRSPLILVAKIASKNLHAETDWGAPVGREPW